MHTRHLTVMFTDIKGFTDKSSGKTRAELVSLLDEHDQLVRPIFGTFGGNIIKTVGDAFLVVFESPTDAVLCGMKIQKTLREHNSTVRADERLEVRVAINSGEVTVKNGDVFGEAVNITARIEEIAEENEIYFTEAVYLAMNKNEVPSAEIGHRYLKGIPNEIKIYKVIQESMSGESVVQTNRKEKREIRYKGSPTRSNTDPWRGNFLVGAVVVGLALLTISRWNMPGEPLKLFLGITLHFYLSYAFYILAKKLNTPHPWLAWAPLINIFYWIVMGQKPWWWLFIYLVPGINLIAFVLTWSAIAEFRKRPRWIGVLTLVPFVNIFVPGYLALVDTYGEVR